MKPLYAIYAIVYTKPLTLVLHKDGYADKEDAVKEVEKNEGTVLTIIEYFNSKSL